MTNFFADLEALRLNNDAAMIGATEVLTHLPVRKPSRSEFFQVHPGEDYSLDTSIYEDKVEREFFLVPPGMRAEFVGEARPVLLRLCVNRQGQYFIWPVKLPGEDGRRNSWHNTALDAMAIAANEWVRLTADMGAGCYRIYKALGELSDPIWPDKSFRELLELAFAQRIIDSPDHPIVRRLRGLN
jgi:hypothetical protein